MTEWWNSLPFELTFFYVVGIISLLVVILQLLLSLLGFGADGADGSFDVGDVDGGTGIGLFSVQTIAAFFVAFGWVGVAATKGGVDIVWVGVIALGSGVISMLAMLYMMRGLMRLQSSGNLIYDTAIGEEGIVYVTIPGSNQDGGQIQVNIQGRLTTANARKSTPGEIKPGQRIKVTAVNGPTSFTVEEIQSPSADQAVEPAKI